MTYAALGTSVRRNLPYLTETERELIEPTEGEQRAREFQPIAAERLHYKAAAEVSRCIVVWLISMLVALLVGGSWLLDGLSETDTARLVELVIVDRAAEQAAMKEHP